MTTFDENDGEYIAALLTGRTVTVVTEDTLELDNGTRLMLVGNQGCGGCGEGWYALDELNGCDNIITSVELVNRDDEVFSIFVYANNEKINLATFSGHDNGYYGVGYTIHVKYPS